MGIDDNIGSGSAQSAKPSLTSNPALLYALIYLALGLLWVLGTDPLFAAIISPQWLAAAGSIKGSVYVIVTAAVFFLVLRRYTAREERDAGPVMPPNAVWAIYLLLALAIAGAGAWTYRQERKATLAATAEMLTAVGEDAADDLELAKREIKAQTQAITNDPVLRSMLLQWLKSGDRVTRQRLQNQLNMQRRNFGYATIALTDRDGHLLLPPIGRPLATGQPDDVKEAWQAGRVGLGELHWHDSVHSLDLHVAAPVLDSAQSIHIVAMAYFVISQTARLNHVIASWPTMGRHGGEKLLARRNADSVQLLARHDGAATLSMLQMSVSQAAATPAGAASMGKRGLYEGVDERGRQMVAVLTPIADSDWSLITTIDSSEVYGQLEQRAQLVGLLITLMILLAGGATHLWLRADRSRQAALLLRGKLERTALTDHYDYIVKYTNDIFLLADERLCIVEANDRAVAAYGYTREELIGMPVSQLRAEQTRDNLTHDFANYVDSGIPYETEQRHRDGSTFPVEISARSIEIEGHRFYQGILRDISERKHAEAAVARSRQRMVALLDSIPDPAWMKDATGHILAANQAYARALGRPIQGIVGKTDIDLWPAEIAARYRAADQRVIAGGVALRQDERVATAFGERWFEIVNSPIIDEAGATIGTTGVARDITERRQYEARLMNINRALHVLSEGNGHLVRAEEESELMQRLCHTLTTTGGYRLAWVGYLADDTLVPMNISWTPGNAPEGARWGPLRRSQLPDDLVWKAVDEGATRWIQDVARETTGPWRDAVLSRGLGALLDLPLKDGDRVIGVLIIGAAQANAFGEEEIGLLQELGGDLAFGIRMLRIRKARDEALQSLSASETKLRTVVENTSDGIVMLDQAGIILFANSGAEKILARPISTLVGSELDIPISYGVPIELVIRDGTTATIELSEAATEWEGKPARIVALHDITARRQVEQERQQHLQEMQDTLIKTIEAMSLTVEKRDPYTAGHQARVADLAVAIGQEMGLPQTQLDGIRLGAMIHDIGKIYIPAEILNRPGRLGEHEIGMIRTHPQVGFDIVKNVDFIWPVKEMIVQHHERMDGSGYPYGLKGDQIALEARILAVADVVEAMSSHRPYRPSLGVERGLEEIRNGSGIHFDSLVVAACLRVFEEQGFKFDFDEERLS